MRLGLSLRRTLSTRESFLSSLAVKAKSEDPLFFAILDNASGRAVGYQTLMRIDAVHRVIEVGSILFTPALQRTIGATEAQYLFARYVFDALGYRRYEWKCNALNTPSRRAAERYGFTFEGVFGAHDCQRPQSRHRLVFDARFGMALAPRRLRGLARSWQFRRGRAPEGFARRAPALTERRQGLVAASW